MKKRLIVAAFSGVFLLPLGEPPLDAASADPLEEIVRLLEAEVPERAIRLFILTERLYPELDTESVIALHRAGASGDLLVFLLERRRPAGDAVERGGGELLYESDGVQAFRLEDPEGEETVVITNLDEQGHRRDVPPELEALETHRLPPSPQRPLQPTQPLPPLPNDERDETPAEESPAPPYAVSPPPAPTPPNLRRRLAPRGMIYVGPFYQFIPANLPGPSSPWSPVFQIVPVLAGGYLAPVPVYPFARLSAVYPPGYDSAFLAYPSWYGASPWLR